MGGGKDLDGSIRGSRGISKMGGERRGKGRSERECSDREEGDPGKKRIKTVC